jgi:hypothetical protein
MRLKESNDADVQPTSDEADGQGTKFHGVELIFRTTKH